MKNLILTILVLSMTGCQSPRKQEYSPVVISPDSKKKERRVKTFDPNSCTKEELKGILKFPRENSVNLKLVYDNSIKINALVKDAIVSILDIYNGNIKVSEEEYFANLKKKEKKAMELQKSTTKVLREIVMGEKLVESATGRCEKQMVDVFKKIQDKNPCLYKEFALIASDAYSFNQKVREGIAIEGEIYVRLSTMLQMIGSSTPEGLGMIVEMIGKPLKDSKLITRSQEIQEVIDELYDATVNSRQFCDNK